MVIRSDRPLSTLTRRIRYSPRTLAIEQFGLSTYKTLFNERKCKIFHGKVLILDETIILSLSSFMFIDEIIVIDPIRMFYRNSRYKFLNKKRDKIIAKIQRRHCVFPRITTGKRIDFYVGICRNSKKTKKEISESPIYS